MMTYVQELKPGMRIIYRGQTLTIESVTYEHGYTATYANKTDNGRTLKYYGGQKVEAVS